MSTGQDKMKGRDPSEGVTFSAGVTANTPTRSGLQVSFAVGEGLHL